MPIRPRTSRETNEPSVLDSLIATVPALRDMPRREVKALRQKPYSLSLEKVPDVLGEDERVKTLTCALSPSRGRGVLALTDRRLVLITERSGTCDWAIDDLGGVRGRPAKFTLPAAIYLDTTAGRLTIVVGDGPVWGPTFTRSVQRAHAAVHSARAA